MPKSEEINLIGSGLIKGTFKKMDVNGQRSLVFRNNPVIYFINLPAGFKGDEEIHENDDDIYYVFEGSGDLAIESDKLKIKKGDFVHIPSKTVHRLSYTKEGIKYIVVKIRN